MFLRPKRQKAKIVQKRVFDEADVFFSLFFSTVQYYKYVFGMFSTKN